MVIYRRSGLSLRETCTKSGVPAFVLHQFSISPQPRVTDRFNFQLLTVYFCRLEISMAAMFWSLFGDLSRQNFKIKEESYDELSITGLVLFAAYKVVAVLVALNMLIAILNESYTRISVIIYINDHNFQYNVIVYIDIEPGIITEVPLLLNLVLSTSDEKSWSTTFCKQF